MYLIEAGPQHIAHGERHAGGDGGDTAALSGGEADGRCPAHPLVVLQHAHGISHAGGYAARVRFGAFLDFATTVANPEWAVLRGPLCGIEQRGERLGVPLGQREQRQR